MCMPMCVCIFLHILQEIYDLIPDIGWLRTTLPKPIIFKSNF